MVEVRHGPEQGIRNNGGLYREGQVNSDGKNRNVGSQRSAEPAALAQTWGSGSSQQGPII